MSDLAQIELTGVFRVMPENISVLWPQLKDIFEPALAVARTHDAEDVRRSLMAMKSQLWVQMSGRDVLAAATTEFVEYPKGLFVRVWLAAAIPERRMDMDMFCDAIDGWREAHGCVGFEAIGRHGWLKRFPGLKPEGLVMRWIRDSRGMH